MNWLKPRERVERERERERERGRERERVGKERLHCKKVSSDDALTDMRIYLIITLKIDAITKATQSRKISR